jgi:rhodanese-related sulfurtransferase
MAVPQLSPAEAHAKMKDEGFTYVDVRREDEFAEGHPEGAVNVPLGDGFVAAMEARFAKDAPLVVGCKSALRSARAAAQLEAAGFTRVAQQRAGWDGVRGTFGEVVEPGWLRCGLPWSR